MEDIIENFAERLGIEPNAARQGISITSRYFIQNSDPIKATGLLSMLPSKFNKYVFYRGEKRNHDKKKNIPPEEVIEKITNEYCNGDKQKGKKGI